MNWGMLFLISFNEFINNKILDSLFDYPAVLIGILIGLSAYFGFFWSFHRVKETSYFKKVVGMVIVVYNFGFYLLIALFFVNIIPHGIFENNFSKIVLEIFIVLYTVFSTFIIVNISSKCDSSISYEEIFPKSINLPTRQTIKSSSIGHLTMVSLSPIILFFSSYFILKYEESLPIGLFLMSIIFLNFSFYAIYLGITPDSYRYAEVFLQSPQKKSYKGRLKRIDENSVDILIKKESGNYMIEIPVNNVSRIELRKLEEIQ